MSGKAADAVGITRYDYRPEFGLLRVRFVSTRNLGAQEDVEPSAEHSGHGGDGYGTVAFPVFHGARTRRK